MKHNAGRIVALASALIIVAVSCSQDVSGPSVPRGVAQAGSKLIGNQLLSCSAMDADSTTQSVGTEGGTIAFGPHQLIIPAGALDSTVRITAVAPSDTVNRVELFPEGLTFNTPASLRLSYANCSFFSALVPKYVVYLDGLGINTVLSSLDQFLTKKVTGSIEHFSGYAVAW